MEDEELEHLDRVARGEVLEEDGDEAEFDQVAHPCQPLSATCPP